MIAKVDRIALIDVEFDKEEAARNRSHGSALTNHPLGLMYLKSAVARHLPDVEVLIIHTATIKSVQAELGGILEKFKPDLVGLRSLSLFMAQFTNAAHLIRKLYPEMFLIGGGPFPSASADTVLEQGLVDLVVIGEGEEVFVELIKSIKKNKQLPTNLAGTAVLEGGKLKINPPHPLIQDVDGIAFPDYDSIDLENYRGLYNHSYISAADCAFLLGTRGCPYKCFYCHDNFGKRLRRRSAENVVEEMRRVYESKGVDDFIFVDDVFNLKPTLGKETLRLIAKELPGVKLHFPNGLRADVFDDEYIDLFVKAGTVSMAMAIESATPRLQKLTGKNLDIDKAVESILETSKHVVMRVFFMVGFPTETLDEAMNTLKVAEKMIHVVEPMLSILRVYPNTPIYDMLQPDSAQTRLLEEQSSQSAVSGLYEDPQFYGDFFSRDKVPMTSKEIKIFQTQWVRKVVMNKERIRTSRNVIRSLLKPEQVESYYEYVYGSSKFTDQI